MTYAKGESPALWEKKESLLSFPYNNKSSAVRKRISNAQEARIRPLLKLQICCILKMIWNCMANSGKKPFLHFIAEEVQKCKIDPCYGYNTNSVGRGKTTTSIGLASALNRIGRENNCCTA